MRTYLREGIPPKDFNMLLGHILGFLLIGEGHILNSYMTLGEGARYRQCAKTGIWPEMACSKYLCYHKILIFDCSEPAPRTCSIQTIFEIVYETGTTFVFRMKFKCIEGRILGRTVQTDEG